MGLTGWKGERMGVLCPCHPHAHLGTALPSPPLHGHLSRSRGRTLEIGTLNSGGETAKKLPEKQIAFLSNDPIFQRAS